MTNKRRVIFKCEDEIRGVEIGPCIVLEPGESTTREVKPGQKRERTNLSKWITITEAHEIARAYGVRLETS